MAIPTILKTYGFIFILALIVRISLIWMTPQGNAILDLCIYIDSGQLISNGVNPYNFQDNTTLRQQLRLDNFAFTPFTCSAQDKWDYFASSNLPLALLTFGAIDKISSTYFFYRFFFALLDSLLCVLIVHFVLYKIILPDSFLGLKKQQIKWIIAAGLGVFNPVLLLDGTIITEHKGTAILLMLGALMGAQSTNKNIKYYVCPLLLGFSIAFIGLGFFLFPLCVWYVCLDENWQISYKIAKKILQFSIIVLLTLIACFFPFLPEILEMMWLRISGSTGLIKHTSTGWYPYFSVPFHSSAWRIVYMAFPENWKVFKNGYLVIFLLINIYGIWKKKFDGRIISANVLLLFLGVLLLDGSLDRINIGLLLTILLVSQSFGKQSLPLIVFYLAGGVLNVLVAFLLQINPHWETIYMSEFKIFESVFTLFFLIIYSFTLLKIAGSNTPVYHQKI